MTVYQPEGILNRNLRLDGYREEFERNARVRIADVLDREFAEEVYACFGRTPWRVTFRQSNEIVSMLGKEFHSLSQTERNELRGKIYAETLRGYQFCYLHMPLLHDKSRAWDEKQVVPALHSLINSSAFLDLGRTVSGVSEIDRADSVATCYTRDSFLTAHPDAPIDDRLVAYVFSFTKEWKADWGGLLQFFDGENGKIVDSLIPAFNALTLFRVPQWHSVSIVTPFAMGPRFSVTGWFRGGASS